MLRDAASGQSWTLSQGRLVVGRKDAPSRANLQPDDSLVLLDDGLVSGAHALIGVQDGRFNVTDTGSRDGTYINEREITEPTPIHEGDRLRFGDTVLVASLDWTETSRPKPAEKTVHQASAPAPRPAVDADQTVFQTPAPPFKPPLNVPLNVPRLPPTPVPASPPAEVIPKPLRPGRSTEDRIVAQAIAPPAADRLIGTPPAPVVQGSIAPAPALAPALAVAGPPEPPVRVVDNISRVHPGGGRSLAELRHAADALSASLGDFEQQLDAAIDLFERNGGRPALETFLACARRVEAEPRTEEDLRTFFSWLPTGCQLLQAELIVMNLLSSRASDASR
jgi:predicted component of type VI protein secretion system